MLRLRATARTPGEVDTGPAAQGLKGRLVFKVLVLKGKSDMVSCVFCKQYSSPSEGSRLEGPSMDEERMVTKLSEWSSGSCWEGVGWRQGC